MLPNKNYHRLLTKLFLAFSMRQKRRAMMFVGELLSIRRYGSTCDQTFVKQSWLLLVFPEGLEAEPMPLLMVFHHHQQWH